MYCTHMYTLHQDPNTDTHNRQRLLTKNTTSFSLAEKMLPRELLQELRMEPVKLKRQKRKRMEPIEEEEEEEEG
jgi:hypothetical protein